MTFALALVQHDCEIIAKVRLKLHLAVRVLEGQVELVVLVQQLEALVSASARAPVRPAGAVDVHVDVFTQLPRVRQPPVPENINM